MYTRLSMLLFVLLSSNGALAGELQAFTGLLEVRYPPDQYKPDMAVYTFNGQNIGTGDDGIKKFIELLNQTPKDSMIFVYWPEFPIRGRMPAAIIMIPPYKLSPEMAEPLKKALKSQNIKLSIYREPEKYLEAKKVIVENKIN